MERKITQNGQDAVESPSKIGEKHVLALRHVLAVGTRKLVNNANGVTYGLMRCGQPYTDASNTDV